MTDKFDKKAQRFLEDDDTARIDDILREYVQYICIDCGEDVDNPGKYVRELNLSGGIQSLTEFRVAKGMLRERVRRNA